MSCLTAPRSTITDGLCRFCQRPIGECECKDYGASK